MKRSTFYLATIILSTFIVAANSHAQCSMGSSGHQHGANNPESHSVHKVVAQSKGYAFINDDGMQQANITIRDGYHPNTIIVKRGIPLRLNFDLQEEGCTATVIIREFDIKKLLTPFEIASVEFTPDISGSFTFACPMNMIEGSIVVKE
ncbi:MAG: cupredoxin domain-containing protein [Ignavibacteriales bacterium]|nr:cupredoxin domain-containing protein [Ignavibacteriales bacterium]